MTMRARLVYSLLALGLVSTAWAQGPPAGPPTADQARAQLCDMNRVQGEARAGEIIAGNLKTITELQADNAKLRAENEGLKKPAPAAKP